MFYLLRLALLLLITGVLATVTILLGLFDRHGKQVYFINRVWTWLILRIAGISLKIQGLENLDPGQQYIFVVNHRSNRADALKSLERAKQRIAAGISVVVFPEGTRSHDGKLLRFKKGGFLLALQTGKNIVPITINGSGRILP